MSLYEKIYSILNGKLIPKDRSEDLENLHKTINITKNKINNMTSQYYSKKIGEINIIKDKIKDDITCYKFYINNINNDNIYDLHGIHGNQVNYILDAIFDYHIEKNIHMFNLITGSGKVIKPKTIKYLKYFDVKYKMKNEGLIEIISY